MGLYRSGLFTVLLISLPHVLTSAAASTLVSRVQPTEDTSEVMAVFSDTSSLASDLSVTQDQNPGRAAISGSDEYDIYFSDRINDLPVDSGKMTFDCVGQIYAVLRFSSSNHEIRNQRMVVEWINPQGELEITDRQAEYGEEGGVAYRWGGISLMRPRGGGLFSFVEPSAGMERFIGTWRVNINLDDHRLPTQSIRVEC
ncbi:MAG: hypothetical protein AAF197_03530 [Pseudomonadota bacterium]